MGNDTKEAGSGITRLQGLTVQPNTAMAELVSEQSKLELFAGQFRFTEGPVWDRRLNRLLVSDMHADAVYSLSDHSRITLRSPSGGANGMALDAQGRLLACEGKSRRVTRLEPNGEITVLVSHFEGKTLNSPNDLICDPRGAIYFTDPRGSRHRSETGFSGVFRISPKGSVQLLANDFELPNGLCFSLDRSRLYINDSVLRHIRIFDHDADGNIKNGRIFFEGIGGGRMDLSRPDAFRLGHPDGMKIDERDNVYCTGPGGIWIISPAGTYIGKIPVPPPIRVRNFCFGGVGNKQLYICAGDEETGALVYRLPMLVAGGGL